jgi:SAM-dependent methyltransferase
MNEKAISIEDAEKKVLEIFPINGYMEGALKTTINIANTIKKYIPPESKILDFGSGPCDKTAVIQYLGYKCSAYDDLKDDWHRLNNNRRKIVQFAKELNIDFRLASNGYLPFQKESFDLVMSHDVLEHLHDSPRELLNDLAELIKPNGLLFITVPNAVNIRKRISVLMGKTNLPRFETYYWYPDPWRGHVREYVRNDLKLLCKYLGFNIVELHGCNHMLRVLPAIIRPLYILITNIFTGWRDSWLLVARKPKDWKAKRNVTKSEFSKILGKFSPYYRDLS